MELNLNFTPVVLKGENTLDIGFRPYDAEELRQLRQEFGHSHIFRRVYKENIIWEIPVIEGATPLSSKSMEIDLDKEYRLWPSLLNAALVRAFYNKREIISDYPIQVLGSEKRNFINNKELPSWVQKRSLLEFNPRTIFDRNDNPVFGCKRPANPI